MSPMPRGYRKSEDAKVMSKQEVAAFLFAARNVERDTRAYYLFALMYLLGLRLGEALILEWGHLGPLDAKTALPVSVQVPTLKQREEKPPLISVPVLSHPSLIAAAFDRKRQPAEHRRARSPWLFEGREPGEHISMTHAHRLFQQVRDTARMRKCLTPHAFRHTAATELGHRGADRSTCARFLRHTERDVTERYLHMRPQDWARFRGALDLPPLKPLSGALP